MTNEDLILGTLLEMKTDIGQIKGKLDASIEAHAERLESLESASTWQWRIQAATLPIIAALHTIASRLGITKS